jgi:excisionase family DNA binding protein
MELTFEQLPKAVGEILKSLERIENLLIQSNNSSEISNKSSKVTSNKFLTVIEAAEFLKLSTPTIYGYTHNRQIPFNKKGKRIYFAESDLIEWIKSGRIKTSNEIEAEAQLYLLNRRKPRS